MDKSSHASSKELGSIAEELAQDYFLTRGYKILERNFRSGPGEIDLILEKGGYLIFVEVKARRSLKYGLPQEAVTLAKQQTIRRVAEGYMQKKKKTATPVRFDVLAITFSSGKDTPSIEHIPFAF